MSAVPWEFSYDGPGPKVPNLPTPAGEELGREVARLAAPLLVRDAQRTPPSVPPCNDCAFVAGTLPNRSAPTLMDAIKCVVEVVPFYCHKGVGDEGTPKRLCAGWVAMVGTS